MGDYSDKNGISTHAPLAGRDGAALETAVHAGLISTHAPLAGRDNIKRRYLIITVISTHAPLAGRDPEPEPEP